MSDAAREYLSYSCCDICLSNHSDAKKGLAAEDRLDGVPLIQTGLSNESLHLTVGTIDRNEVVTGDTKCMTA